MLRARYCLLLGSALGVETSLCEKVAVAMEFVHSASLLHDDCIDGADMRRGLPTPNALFGRTTGILLGDIAFTEGLEEATGISPFAVEALVRAVREMTVGEIQEEFLRGSLRVSRTGYYGVAGRKTGALFAWCGEVLSESSPLPHRRGDPPRLGQGAGILLQIIDDIHDFTLKRDVAGKESGRDFLAGRLTLPGILAMEDEAFWPRFKEIWDGPRNAETFAKALELLRKGGHLEIARDIARDFLHSLFPLVDALPLKEQSEELRAFMELMFRREF
jgi:octaprenyl-diphosphate synthase